ncbi:deoxyguanosinetriphosphate triphosphohydrolase [Neisseria sp. Ec49-e6-T10]|uniref:deoxyguanosinetriphosphate triphosphohydrolase n=1 Tax=Neisseria sp. Ec49-e6-T10 TaxID=3140744 RepID=UPI003EBF2FDF
MQWTQLLSTQRFAANQNQVYKTQTPSSEEGKEALRSDFLIDYDRIVFSSAFRRLGRKTQVHPLAQHDHIHNRLTHSVEVASVGRSLGNRVGVMLLNGGFLPKHHTPLDIGQVVQVACLAHDLGNPPFGHTGEDALRDWFTQPTHQIFLEGLTNTQKADIQTYEGNAHSLRMVANLEMYQNQGGMRLSAATIGTLLKYPWTSSHPLGTKKFSIYQTELPFIQHIAKELGLPEQQTENHWARHPLSYLMEAADDICYAILDLEDAVEIGLLEEKELENILSQIDFTERTWQAKGSKQRCAMLRGIAIGKCIEEVAQKFMMHHDSLLNGNLPVKDLLSVCNAQVSNTLAAAKELAYNKIYRHRDKLVTEIAAYPCIATILDLLIPAVFMKVRNEPIPARLQLALELLKETPIEQDDTLYNAYMKVLDFIGAMTDNTAAKMARELSGVGII